MARDQGNCTLRNLKYDSRLGNRTRYVLNCSVLKGLTLVLKRLFTRGYALASTSNGGVP